MDCPGSLLALDDAALLREWRVEGNADAVTLLYLRYRPQLLAYGAAHLAGDRDAAKDLVQDTWEAVLTYRKLGTNGHFRGLVFKIAHSLVVNAARWRAAREAAREELERRNGQLVPDTKVCRYCDRIIDQSGLCRAHAARAARGASEESMKRPVRGYRRST